MQGRFSSSTLARRDHLALLLPLLLVTGPFLVLPAIFGFLASFTSFSPFALHLRFTGLANYASLLEDGYFKGAFRTAAAFSFSAVVLELAIGMGVAWLLREPFRGRGAVRMVLLLPWLVSPVASGVMWHFLYESSEGIPNYFLGLLHVPLQPSPLGLKGFAFAATLVVEVWRTAPLASFLLLPGFSLIPRQLWEHATLEGATLLSQFRHIALPSLRPLVLTVAMLLAGTALGTFDSILILTHGGPGTETLTPAVYSFQRAFQVNNWPLGATSAWFITAAVAAVGGALSRAFAPGGGPVSGLRQGLGRGRRRRKGVRAVLLALVIIASVLPLAWTALASVGIHPDNVASPPTWSIRPTLESYAEVGAAEAGFWKELASSITTSAASTLLTVVISFLGAYSLVHSRMRGKRRLVQGFLVLASLPAMAYVIPLDAAMRVLVLHDTFIGVVLAQAAIFAPLAVYVLFGYLAQVTFDFEEAAKLEGASPWRTIVEVILPMNAPGVAAAAIIVFVLNWNSFLAPMVITTDHVRTIPIAMSDFFTFDRELEWPTAAAALTISLVPLAALAAASSRVRQRFFLGAVEDAG